MKQAEIFPQALPPGLIYREDFISIDEERQLLSEIRGLTLLFVNRWNSDGTAQNRTTNLPP